MCSVAHVCPPARTTVSNFFPFLTSFHPPTQDGYCTTQSLENLRALVDHLQSQLALVEDSRLDSPFDYREARPEGPAPSRRPDAQPFPSAEQTNAPAHMTAELNSTRRHAREVEQTSTARSPGAPTGGPGASVPPHASDAQGLQPIGTVTSRHADGIRPPMDANFASETQALPYAAGGMQEARRVPYADDQDRGGAARGSRESIVSFDPRWGGYQTVDLTAHPGPVDIRTLPVTPFGTLGPAAPGVKPVHTMIQEFSDVANYGMYRLDNTVRLVTSDDAGRIAKYVQRCRGIRPTMRSFDSTDATQLLPNPHRSTKTSTNQLPNPPLSCFVVLTTRVHGTRRVSHASNYSTTRRSSRYPKPVEHGTLYYIFQHC